jgi:DNA-binding MarR family transcriptional regulator
LRHPRLHDDLLNYRLKRLFVLGGAPAVRLCEGRFGLTRFEWRVLAALVEGGVMSPTPLCTRIGVEAGRVSRTVASLCDKRLVARSPDPVDGRRATLRATPEGVDLYAHVFPCLAAINTRLVSVLDQHELEVLDRCLDKLTDQARAVLASGGGGVDVRPDRRHGGSRQTWDRAARAIAAEAERGQVGERRGSVPFQRHGGRE